MTRRDSNRLLVIAALAVFSAIADPADAQTTARYTIEALPALEADPACPVNSNATAINERGDVVGVAESSYYDGYCHIVPHAVIWRDGETIDLGGIPPYDNFSGGNGINDNGDAVVGYGTIDFPGGQMSVPSYWNDTDGMILITDGDEFPTGWAWGVNNAHQVAVTYRNQAHYWDAATGLRLIEFDYSPPGSSSNAWEINNNGIVVGAARGDDTNLHAFRYDSVTDTIEDLHDPAFRHSIAYGLNDNSDVAGFVSAYSNYDYPAIWPADGGLIDLPTAVFGPGYSYCKAEHINDRGDVVGTDGSGLGEPSIAWVAFNVLGGNTDRVALVDLLSATDAAAWSLRSGFEINNSRQITGIGLFNGETRGYLMTRNVVVDAPQVQSQLATKLFPCSPNPFNPRTTVMFSLVRDEWAKVGVYGLTGKRVAVLADRTFSAGDHSLLWNGRDTQGRAMPSGTYIVRLKTESGVEERKVSLIR